MNELNVTEQETIRGLLQLGWSRRRIARETGHHRATIDKVANDAAAEAAQRTVVTDTVSAADVEAGDAKSRSAEKVAAGSTGRSLCEPRRWFIAAEVAKGRNAVAIYQDLVEHHGYVGAYNAVKRFVRSLCPTTVKTSCRFETEPGYEAQADYGEGALTKHPQTGTYRRPRLFVMSLGCSRHAFRKTVWKSSKETWCELHEDSFAYFGGVKAT